MCIKLEAAQDGYEMILWKMPLEPWLYIKRNKIQPSANTLKKVSLKMQRREKTSLESIWQNTWTSTQLKPQLLYCCFIKDCNLSWISCTFITYPVTAWQAASKCTIVKTVEAGIQQNIQSMVIFLYYIKLKWNPTKCDFSTEKPKPGLSYLIVKETNAFWFTLIYTHSVSAQLVEYSGFSVRAKWILFI